MQCEKRASGTNRSSKLVRSIALADQRSIALAGCPSVVAVSGKSTASNSCIVAVGSSKTPVPASPAIASKRLCAAAVEMAGMDLLTG